MIKIMIEEVEIELFRRNGLWDELYGKPKCYEILSRIQVAESQLAQFEREIPKAPEGFPELDKDHLVKICIHQQSKLAELDSREEWVTNGQGEITTQPISEFLNPPKDHHLVAISNLRAQIEAHQEAHAEQIAAENAKLQKPFTHRFNNSGLHDAN